MRAAGFIGLLPFVGLATFAGLAFGQGENRTAAKRPDTKAYRVGKEFSMVYDVKIGVSIEGGRIGARTEAATAVPIDWPEQQVELVSAETHSCRARIKPIGEGASMLVVETEPMAPGKKADAVYHFRVKVDTIRNQWSEDDFPEKQPKLDRSFDIYLRPSPGIQSNDAKIKKLAQELAKDLTSEWDKVIAYFVYVHKEIEYREGKFTSAKKALETKVGDCEEKASLFIALCRAGGIPARTVWSPGHCWAEFYLVDKAGRGHWIPAHTAGIAWFASLGHAQVILQKGDNFKDGSGRNPKRLLAGWFRGVEPRPNVSFLQEFTPIETIEKTTENVGNRLENRKPGPTPNP